MKTTKFISHILISIIINIFGSTVFAQNNSHNCNALIDKTASNVILNNVTCSYSNSNKIARVVSTSPAQPILVLNKLENFTNPMKDVIKPENHLGLVEPGAKVKIIGETKAPSPLAYYSKIEILQGRLKSQVAWIATSTIVLEDVYQDTYRCSQGQ